ncbi:MAG: UDP-N-acetylmuramoyl-tripeptide--D-alanyl-D-alanine ligase [Acidobacteriales bacterium]|nr:UDP-N-acetylmuramoyl-tripeptide--D-alanyl-D-alanine ligase [Terriglobales bacterium]
MRLSLREIAGVLGGTAAFDSDAQPAGYSIDSRTIRKGELFFAVKGERFDGHDFADDALQRGAVAAVVAESRAQDLSGRAVIAVPDPLLALQQLAAEVRRIWAKPLIGVTGSAGKTTTKELIACVLSSEMNVFKSEGNLNNHFGLPLMLLQLKPEYDVAVIEMGMSHAGEIRALAGIAKPDIGVFTCVAPVHLEFFRSVDEIALAKYELMEALPASGTAVLNANDRRVAKFGERFAGRTILYGSEARAEVRAENIKSLGSEGWKFDVVAGDERMSGTLAMVGRHNISNALAALAVAWEHGVPLTKAVAALTHFRPVQKRGEVIRVGNITVLNDCYNSNPKALDCMVGALMSLPATRHIVVAGEMLELGESASDLHRSSGRHMAEQKVDLLLGVRGLAREIVAAAGEMGVRAEFVDTPEEAGAWLAREAREGDAVLLKASRGVKLETALERWQSDLATRQA